MKQFATISEVDAFLGAPRLRCPICGKSFKWLALHASKKHGILAADFKELLGVPRKRGVITAAAKESRGAITRAYFASLSPQEMREHIVRLREFRARPQIRPAGYVPAVLDAWRKRGAACKGHKYELVEVRCADCGGNVRRPSNVIAANVVCEECLVPRKATVAAKCYLKQRAKRLADQKHREDKYQRQRIATRRVELNGRECPEAGYRHFFSVYGRPGRRRVDCAVCGAPNPRL